jgi:hypothetical protein
MGLAPPLRDFCGRSLRPWAATASARRRPLRFGCRRGPKTAKTKGIFRQTKRKVSRRGRKSLQSLGCETKGFRQIVCFQRVDRHFVSRFLPHALLPAQKAGPADRPSTNSGQAFECRALRRPRGLGAQRFGHRVSASTRSSHHTRHFAKREGFSHFSFSSSPRRLDQVAEALGSKPNRALAPVTAWGIAAVRRRRSARPPCANNAFASASPSGRIDPWRAFLFGL